MADNRGEDGVVHDSDNDGAYTGEAVETNTGETDTGDDAVSVGGTDYYNTPAETQRNDNNAQPSYTALPRSSQPQTSGCQGYERHLYHRGGYSASQDSCRYGYGSQTFQQRPRGDFFHPMSHIGYGGHAGDQGYRPLRSPPRNYDRGITLPRRPNRLPALGQAGAMHEYLTKGPDASTTSPQPQVNSPKVALSEENFYGGDIEMLEITDNVSLNGGQEVALVVAAPEKQKQKQTNSKNSPVISLDEDFDNDDIIAIDSDEDLFVAAEKAYSEDGEPVAPQTGRGRKSSGSSNSTRVNKNRRVGRPPAGAIGNAPHFETSMSKMQAALKTKNPKGDGLVPSRSDRKARWETHAAPKLMDVTHMSQEEKKKGIAPDATGLIPERQTGANDPENIKIVNLKDVDGLSFEDIAKIINKDRIKNGRNPNQKANSINCRYNRTAPAMYQMQGIPFVRIADRAKANGTFRYTKDQEDLIWTREMDDLLVEIEGRYIRNKWNIIAKQFASRSGHNFASAQEVANRFVNI